MAQYVATSERLGLQSLNISDHLEGFHALNADERVSRWSHRHPSADLSTSTDLMRKRLPSEKEPWQENYAIILRSSQSIEKNTMIGVVGVLRLSHDGKAAEVGYGLIPAYWGGGYATQALVLFTKHYWNSDRKVQKESLTAETEPGNVPSERVLSKAGFQRGDFVQGAFEVTDLITGKLVKKDATTWRIDRPSA